MTKMYVYNEATRQCLFVIEGALELVQWEAAAHLEQNGTPSQLTTIGLRGVAQAEILNAGEVL